MIGADGRPRTLTADEMIRLTEPDIPVYIGMDDVASSRKTVPAVRKNGTAVTRANVNEPNAYDDAIKALGDDVYSEIPWADINDAPRLTQNADVDALNIMRNGGDDLPPVNRTIEPSEKVSRVRTNTMLQL